MKKETLLITLLFLTSLTPAEITADSMEVVVEATQNSQLLSDFWSEAEKVSVQ